MQSYKDAQLKKKFKAKMGVELMTCEIVLHTAQRSVLLLEGDQMQTKFCAPHWVSEHKYFT